MRSRCFFLKSNGGQVRGRGGDPPARQPDPLRPGRRADRRQALRRRHRLAGRLHARHGRHERRRRRHHRRARSAAARSTSSSGACPIAVPTVDLSTIGAGGSSIAGFDSGGFLKVGPESAGADPGPAAYGKGGDGRHRHRREPRARPAQPGLLPRRRARAAPATCARRAIEPIAERLGLLARGRRAGDRRAGDGEHGRRRAPAGGRPRPRLPPLRARRVRRRRARCTRR